jgi:hypothetical protein
MRNLLPLAAILGTAAILGAIFAIVDWVLEQASRAWNRRRYRQSLGDLQRHEVAIRRREALERFARTGHGKG